MKNILMCSLIGMLAAGIYGTIDMTFDLRNGSFIQYESDEELPSVAQLSGLSKGLITKTNVHVPRHEKKTSAPPTLINSFEELSFGDFSRALPPTYETTLLESLGQPDSLNNTDVSAAINDTIASLNEKSKSDSLTKKEERIFNVKLFSRGKPRPVVKQEEVALENDSAKMR